MDIEQHIAELKNKKVAIERDYDKLEKEFRSLDSEEEHEINFITAANKKIYEKLKDLMASCGIDYRDLVVKHNETFFVSNAALGIKPKETISKDKKVQNFEMVLNRSKRFTRLVEKHKQGRKIRECNGRELELRESFDRREATPDNDPVLTIFKGILDDLRPRLDKNQVADIEAQIATVTEMLHTVDRKTQKSEKLAESLNDLIEDNARLEQKLESLIRNREKYRKHSLKDEEITRMKGVFLSSLPAQLAQSHFVAKTLCGEIICSCRERLERNDDALRAVEDQVSKIDDKLLKFNILDDVTEMVNKLNESSRIREMFKLNSRLRDNSPETARILYNILQKYSGGDSSRLIDGLKRMGVRKNLDEAGKFIKTLEELGKDGSAIDEYRKLISQKDDLLKKWQRAKEQPELLRQFIRFYSEI